MKKNFLFGLLTILVAWFWFGGISMAECTISDDKISVNENCVLKAAISHANTNDEKSIITIEVPEGDHYLSGDVKISKNIVIKWPAKTDNADNADYSAIIKHNYNWTSNYENKMWNESVLLWVLDDNISLTFENVRFELKWNVSWYWFEGWENSKVTIKDSTVAWRLSTYTDMNFEKVDFIKNDVNTYNMDIHEWSEITFNECTFEQYNRNINIYDYNNHNKVDNHNVTFNNCKFKTTTTNKWAIVIHESHSKQDYAVNYNVTINDADISEWKYPTTNEEVIWKETDEKSKWYFSKIVAAGGLVMIDDIRRVIVADWWEISVTVNDKDKKEIYSYRTPKTTAVTGITKDNVATLDELKAVVNWYRSEWYCIWDWNWKELNTIQKIIVTEATDETAEAKIWDKKYCKLDDAIEFAENNNPTITLLKDIESDHQITIDKPLTLDWGNHKLTVTFGNEYTLNADTAAWILVKWTNNVTIQNIKVDGPNKEAKTEWDNHIWWKDDQHIIKVYNSTNVTIKNVEVNYGSEAMHFNGWDDNEKATVKLESDIKVWSNCTWAWFEAENSIVDVSEANIDKSVWVWDDAKWKSNSEIIWPQWVKTTENTEWETPTFKQYTWTQTKEFKATFKDWETVLKEINVEYWNTVSYWDSNPTKSCYSFAGWSPEIPTTMPAEDIVMAAKWTYTCSSSSSSGKSWGSSTTKKEETKATTWSANEEIVLGWEVTEESTNTEEVKEENTKPAVVISDAAKATYNEEQLAAYQWAYENDITTINDADEARLWDPLTRAELAKMMSQYISSVLKKSPIKADKPEYKDVDESLGDLADFIVKAYQYQIMGIDADGNALEYFNPNGLVTRAEYATVFSRVLYWSVNNQKDGPYYEKHLAALKEAGILSNDDPTIQEVRGWVMLMMYRSANEKASTQEESKTEEWTGNNVWIANPASTYCVEQEWEIEIREEADGGQYGVCKFKDGTEVEEWEYFRANHKDETSTGAVAESSTGDVAETTTWAVAEATTWATAETSTGSTTKSN